MKIFNLKLGYTIILSIFLISCSQDDDMLIDKTSTLTDVPVTYSPMEYQILSLLNEHRGSVGLAVLEIINVISKEAEGHTDYMIQDGKPSHDNFPDRYKYLVEKASATKVGENVAYGYSTAQAVVTAWIKSSGHRQNLENTDYTHFGISTKQNAEGRNYFTNIFISR